MSETLAGEPIQPHEITTKQIETGVLVRFEQYGVTVIIIGADTPNLQSLPQRLEGLFKVSPQQQEVCLFSLTLSAGRAIQLDMKVDPIESTQNKPVRLSVVCGGVDAIQDLPYLVVMTQGTRTSLQIGESVSLVAEASLSQEFHVFRLVHPLPEVTDMPQTVISDPAHAMLTVDLSKTVD